MQIRMLFYKPVVLSPIIICSPMSPRTATAVLREMRTANKEVDEPKSKLQLISVGPVSQDDADKIYSLCKELCLVEKNLYKSEGGIRCTLLNLMATMPP